MKSSLRHTAMPQHRSRPRGNDRPHPKTPSAGKHPRRTRLTNAFSKKVENLHAAVALHFAHYNFVRLHRSLNVTPAMQAGVSKHLWSLGELVERTSV
jgi:hypothetical protein